MRDLLARRAALERELRGEEPIPEPLSQREVQVLQAVADGLNGLQAAQRLGIEHKTVRNHLNHIYRKLRTPHGRGAVAIGFRQGLLR